MDKRDGGCEAKCITESERLRDCDISKHITLEQQWHALTECWWRAEREGGQESFCFISVRCVCIVCPTSADWVLTSAHPGYTNSGNLSDLSHLMHTQRGYPLTHTFINWQIHTDTHIYMDRHTQIKLHIRIRAYMHYKHTQVFLCFSNFRLSIKSTWRITPRSTLLTPQIKPIMKD